MNDYTWPSVYFAYFFFALCFLLAAFFFVRSWKDGYWTKQGEDVKYQVFDGNAPVPDVAPAAQAEEETHVTR